MATIPNLNWKKQTQVPSDEFEEESKDQLVGCIKCAMHKEGPTPPPGTIFYLRGTAVCYEHVEWLVNQLSGKLILPTYPQEENQI